MRKFFLFLLSAFCLLPSLAAQTRDFTRWVNPFIGTGGHGHTFPGATLPFGMVQLSPDTRTDNWDGSSGYHYSDDIIYGFSHTHLSGTGIPDGCDILFMPMIGEQQFFAKEGDKLVNGYASKFSHASEKAEPGYYSVKLDDDGILAEMTATERVGFHRYTFPNGGRSQLILDLGWRDAVTDTEIHLGSNHRVEGSRRSTSWAKNQTTYFVAEFSKAFVTGAISTGPDSSPEKLKVKELARGGNFSMSGNGPLLATFGFPSSREQQILVKVAISFVSIEGARKNLEAELPGWNFDKVRADAKAAWNKELSKIEVSGGTDDQTTTFYTALYHTMIHPNVFNDVDGRYLGHDRKAHQLPGYEKGRKGEGEKGRKGNPRSAIPNPQSQYSVFSLWDTFRAAHPLYTIIDQKRTVDFINTFIRIYEQGGRLPVWELWGEETDTMIGYHAVSVIADAMGKGIKGFDYEKAYAAAKHSAELDHFGLAAYKKRGYISMEDENESVSKTLEYAYGDWCIARMERALDKGPDITRIPALQYLQRARNFENLFDPRVNFFVPRKNGGFVRPFAPSEVTFGFTEGNSWQYSFFVPHDIDRLIELMGGREYFAGKLVKLFTTQEKLAGREQADLTGLIGQYAHGNEPSHHIPYLFNYAGVPWRTQFYVRKIMDEFYRNSPDGLIGNEDCGQMSAWFVLSAAGFYPVTPGDPRYALGSPIFPEMTFHLENGRTFTVRAMNTSPKNVYVRSVTIDGARLARPAFDHADLIKGGVLEFTMTDEPKTNVFDLPTATRGKLFSVAAPWIDTRKSSPIFMGTVTEGARIFYTVDGSEPSERSTRYIVPVRLDPTVLPSVIKAIAIDTNGVRSKVVEASLYKRPNNWAVTIVSPYSTQYTGGGDNAIVDGIRGTTNFASGEWQGVQGKTFEAVIDLQTQTEIKSVGGSFLQVVASWIWMPDRVEFETSKDGIHFAPLTEITPGFPQQEMNPTVKEYRQTIHPVWARYVRVKAHNFGKIPAWHPGAGGDPWIFVDEIFID